VRTYEQLLSIVQRLQAPETDADRLIDWCVPQGPVGVARTPDGRIEIFLEGRQLPTRLRRVRDAMEYQRWYRAGGDLLLANRLLLPGAGHFEQVAAFLCTELLRNGATVDLAHAFMQTEPLIELAIADLEGSDEAFLGLCGELMLLAALVRASPAERVGEIVASWKGYGETARDFQVGSVGVEVKSTTRATSSHTFGGVHQLELGHGVGGVEESHFMVVSLGLEWATQDDMANTISLPETVDDVILRVTEATGSFATTVVAELVSNIALYGATAGLNYDHSSPTTRMRFGRRFRLRFARGYDKGDEAVRLLTTDDMRARPFIDADSMFLRVNFPDRVSGDINPLVGLSNCAMQILLA
jgi:hypothetical protein